KAGLAIEMKTNAGPVREIRILLAAARTAHVDVFAQPSRFRLQVDIAAGSVSAVRRQRFDFPATVDATHRNIALRNVVRVLALDGKSAICVSMKVVAAPAGIDLSGLDPEIHGILLSGRACADEQASDKSARRQALMFLHVLSSKFIANVWRK